MFSAVGSNVFSNVPFVSSPVNGSQIFTDPLMWKVMALTTTFAGNLTILGSVANISSSNRATARRGWIWDYANSHSNHSLHHVAGVIILLTLG